MRPARPNIVLILADDMGYGDLSSYGHPSIRTPNIDRLGEEGMVFTDFHSNGPVCSPTRAALLTGRYQQRCGIEGVITAAGHREVGLAETETTFASPLRDAGYATAVFGKWHLGYAEEFNPTRRGFDRFRGFVSGNVDYQSHIDQVGYEDWWQADRLTPETGYTTDLVTRHGVEFINEHAADSQPFCLYLAHECPHYPYQGPDDSAYRRPGDPGPPIGPREDTDVAYREMIEALDAGVGEVLSALERKGVAEQTFVFFFSDNGPTGPGSSGALRGRKGSVWEGGHRVPAMARMPGVIAAGGQTNAVAVGMDLFPTMLELAGVESAVDRQLDGTSLLPVLTGSGGLPDRDVFWRFGGRRAVRRGRFKLVRGEEGGDWLSDLDHDLGETANVVDARGSLAQELRIALEQWEEDVSRGVHRLA